MKYSFDIRLDVQGAKRKRVMYSSTILYATRETAERVGSMMLLGGWTPQNRWLHIREVP
jgi:hypothetical protein